MALGLPQYLESLEERKDLLWPQPPAPVPLKASPAMQPLPGLRVVAWNVYGTLLQIDQGELLHRHPQDLRMQIALDKTIKEFNMWNSMSRKPGQPWEYMLRQYQEVAENAGMVSTKKKGDVPELDSRKIWKKLIERLIKNEYAWDEGKLGDLDDLAVKVAYFFHASLQGTAASEGAAETLGRLQSAGIRNGLIADGQVFTLAQLLRDLRRQDPSQPTTLAAEFVVLSTSIGLKKPSESLFRQAVSQYEQRGVKPDQVLYVTQRLQDDLAVARKCGFHTALYAADKNVCRVQAADLRNPDWKPDRLITDLRQVLEILSI
jgi:FMN phosphatase YigB (HAD superfamily)